MGIAGLACLAVVGGGCGEGDAGPAGQASRPGPLERATSPERGVPFEETVTITESGYRPRAATILIGGSITWVNMDPSRPHTAETQRDEYEDLAGGQDSSFDTHTLSWEEPYTVTFHFPGTIEYGSSYDPWKGTIEVVAREPPR